MKRLRFCLLPVVVLLTGGLFFGCADSPYPDPERPASVTIAALGGVIAPTNGAIPATVITPTTQYTGTIAWSPADADFQPTTVYTATVTLTALEGFSFYGLANNFFTVAGATSVSYTNTANGAAVVKAVFPQTEQVDIVTLTNIPGVTAPATGGVPVTTIDTAQYTGTIVWNPAHSIFNPDTTYSATITLSPKTGYVFTGLPANAFRVNDITGTSAADSGVVGVTFPQTGPPTVVNIATIPGVTVPVTSAVPVTSILETSQYTGSVVWSPADATFQPFTVYQATITLSPKVGYTFTGVSANFFTNTGATNVSNSADSGVVTAIFPATGDVPPPVPAFSTAFCPERSNPYCPTDTSDGNGAVWFEFKVASVSAFANWQIYVGTRYYANLVMSSSDVSWTLSDNDVIRVIRNTWNGTTDVNKGDAFPGKWTYKTTNSNFLNYQYGMIWIVVNGSVVNVAPYTTQANTSSYWLENGAPTNADVLAILTTAVGEGQWGGNDTISSGITFVSSTTHYAQLTDLSSAATNASGWTFVAP